MSVSTLNVKPDIRQQRREFYERLGRKSAAPLWEVLAGLVTPEPRGCVPAIWHYDEIRPLLREAGELITADEAERRVLVLENPAFTGESRITSSLYAGIQLVMPGETARTHRHTASALRFVLESSGGYTAVNGERATMSVGDFIITPSWTWHDHGNDSAEPVIWLDVLDIPLVNQLSSSFAEHYERETQPLTRPEGDSLLRYGSGMIPVDYKPDGLDSPTFAYPYSRSRASLEHFAANSEIHPAHGFRMRFVNPATGGYPMATIATFLQLLPPGFRGTSYRSTDATVYCVAEGHGKTCVGGETFDWGPRDIFVVPSWHAVSHSVAEQTILFSASDRPVQQLLGIWREQV